MSNLTIAKKEIKNLIKEQSEIYLSAGENSILNCCSSKDEINSVYKFDIQEGMVEKLYNTDSVIEIIEKYNLKNKEEKLIDFANEINSKIILKTFAKLGYEKDNYETSQNYGAWVFIKTK